MQLVFLHGSAASGKLTTARALSDIVGFPVFHNHLVVDALLEAFPFGSPEFVRLRELFWIETFQAAALSGRSLVFTFTPEPTVPRGFAERVRRSVESLGGSVLFVRLDISAEEQERRIENADRRAFNKLSSLDTLRKIREAEAAAIAEAPLADDPVPADLVIVTETSPPEQTARAIVEHFGLRPVTQARGYP